MKRFFLIPLMTLLCSVMAFAGNVGTLQELKDALAAGGDITLTDNISGINAALNVNKSVAIDGQGHMLSGAIVNKGILTLVGTSDNMLEVAISNLHIKNTTAKGIAIHIGGYLDSLSIDNSTLECPTKGNNKSIEFDGPQPQNAKIGIRNSTLIASASGYPVRSYNPVNLYMENCSTSGYCALNFQSNIESSSNPAVYTGFSGARGSIIYAKSCDFDAPNVHNGQTNSFAVFNFTEDGIDLTLDNCGMNAQVLGNQSQAAIMINPFTPLSRREQDINITFKGDNTHINGEIGTVDWINYQTLTGSNYIAENGVNWYDNTYDPSRAFTYTAEVNITMEGGTYAVNPAEYEYYYHLNTAAEGYNTSKYPEDAWFTMKKITIPSTHEVKTVNQGGVTLYRVVKKAAADPSTSTLYDLNANVENQGNGDNPATSFELSTGTNMTLNQETTEAGYVQVKDNGTTATTVTVGNSTQDQTLVINNGLDVQGNSKVDVQAGSTLVIGEGGITTEDPKNIVIEADRAGAASLIMDPAITVNQTPNLTVRMTAKQIGKTADGEFWHRFAMPVQHANSWDKEGSLGTGNDKYPTYLYGWNYSSDSWYKLPGGVSDMQAFMGYTLRLATEETATDQLQDVVYIFKGQLAGNTNNTLQFSRNGYNFFGNSYTGYIDLKQLVAQITGDSKIEGTAWVWNTDLQRYQDVPLNLLAAGIYDGESDKWKTEIAPMQTFILKQNGSNNASTEINYASAVWGNPRYSAATGVVAAPARRVADMNTTRMYIAVTAANGQSDEVFFVEDANYSDAFDNGYDASKYMNPNTINVFANQNGIDLGTVASDNLNGKTLSLKTNGELAYTMSFKNVEGEEYAIRDNVTGAVINIEEGATYEFAAQPNSTIEGRFEIVAAAKIPTAIDNTEVKANVKGIYTIMGQYLGENFDILPAGVYVVDGVKIVK